MRALARVLVVFLVLSSFQRPSYAFAPVAVLSAPQIVSAGGASYALGALAGLVGVVGLYVTISDDEGNTVRAPLGPNPQNEPPAPYSEPVTQPTTPAQPSPQPATQVVKYCASHSPYPGCVPTNCTFQTGYGSLLEACQAAGYSGVASNQSQCSPNSCGSVGGIVRYTCPEGWTYSQYMCYPPPPTPQCPSGYQLVGSSCELVNPRKATDDKTCDTLLQNGAFATADDLNCGTVADGQKLSPMIRDGSVIAYGRNSKGEPLLFEVRPGAQTFTIRQSEQVTSATQTLVQTTTVTVDAATSEIVSVQTSTSPGQISSPSGSSVPTQLDPETQPSTQNTPTVQTNPSQQMMPELQLPTDYAREPTVQQIRDALTQQSSAPSDPQPHSEQDIFDLFFHGTFDGLRGWSLPSHVSQCPTSSFSFFGQEFIINSHCQLISEHWDILSSVMTVFWVLVALFIVLGA